MPRPVKTVTLRPDVLAESWQKADLVEEKSDVIHAFDERIVIEGPRFVGLRMTPAAYRHGLALALPEAIWRARQELDAGLQPTESRSKAAMTGSPRRRLGRRDSPEAARHVLETATERQMELLAGHVRRQGVQ